MEKMGKILVVDDNEDVLFALHLLLESYVEKVKVATSPDKILPFMESFQPDVILLDMNFQRDMSSGQEGFDCLEEILRRDPEAVVVFMTAYSDTEKAVRAIKAGATDFIPKPWDKEKLLATLSSAIKLRRSRREVKQLQERVETLNSAGDEAPCLIGRSAPMLEVVDTIHRLSGTDANILILGENGTGKDVVARTLCYYSPRRTQPFVTIDVGSIPENLFESELFGYEKGAFTDARREKAGRMEAAHGGTLFLDEIGNLPLPMQAKLLTALEKGNVVVFDVESTGTDTTRDDIIQIAAIRLNERCEIAGKFNAYVRPSRSVGDSYYIHHISDELLRREGRDPKEALADFLRFADGAVIVGHNVSYDLRILRSELRRLSMDSPDDIAYYDTLDIFRRFYPNLPNHKLSYLSNRFTPDTQSSHDAFDDIVATAAILRYALDEHIRPYTAQRRSCMAIYASLFKPVSEKLHELRQLSYTQRPCELIAAVMLRCGVKDYYEGRQSRTEQEEHIDRMENIRKLYSLAKETDTPGQDPRDALTEFLQLTALSNSELDSLLEKKPQIPIITVHQAKGLEFDYVFLASLQDGVFPLSRTADDSRELDEEKRLFYVAMTRARKRLFLSWHRREGKHVYGPSRFIAAIPGQYLLQEAGQAK